MLALKLFTAPTEEPVGLEEAKRELRVDHNDDDTRISALISAARTDLEEKYGRAFVTQTFDWQLDRFPCDGDVLWVPRAPLRSITSITYVDEAGVAQAWLAAKRKVDVVTEPGRVMPAYGEYWPSARAEIGAVTVRFEAGFGAPAAVPQPIRSAVLLRLHQLYDGPADERADAALERAIADLMRPYKVHLPSSA